MKLSETVTKLLPWQFVLRSGQYWINKHTDTVVHVDYAGADGISYTIGEGESKQSFLMAVRDFTQEFKRWEKEVS